jgi:hypothetical protein
MTIERPMFPPRRDASPFRVVAGIDFAPSAETAAPAPAQGRRKRRGAYNKDRKPIEYQNGLPVIDPEGEEDRIFRHIAEHRAAVAHYDRCVDIEGEAEGKVSEDEFFYLQHNTRNAFDTMMLWARAVIGCCPTTRRGLIHQARYLVSQFNEEDGGCTYLPEMIGDRPWPMAFLRHLATGLRKMAGELDPQDEGDRQRTTLSIFRWPTARSPKPTSFIAKLSAILRARLPIARAWQKLPPIRYTPTKLTTANWSLQLRIPGNCWQNSRRTITPLGTTRSGVRHEAPAPIGQKAQPATAGRSLETA